MRLSYGPQVSPYRLLLNYKGASNVAEWVKNLTAAAWVTVEAWMRPPSPAQWVKKSSIATAVV